MIWTCRLDEVSGLFMQSFLLFLFHTKLSVCCPYPSLKRLIICVPTLVVRSMLMQFSLPTVRITQCFVCIALHGRVLRYELARSTSLSNSRTPLTMAKWAFSPTTARSNNSNSHSGPDGRKQTRDNHVTRVVMKRSKRAAVWEAFRPCCREKKETRLNDASHFPSFYIIIIIIITLDFVLSNDEVSFSFIRALSFTQRPFD